MSNKNKAQQQQPQQPQPQQQQQHHQYLHSGSHVISKQVDQQVPPQYQPPPQPTVGILKNHPHFGTGISGVPSGTIPNTLGLATTTLNHQQQQQQSQALRATTNVKDAHGKFSAALEHPQQPAIITNSTKNPNHAYLPSKLPTGQYLPPNSQYPTTVPISVPRQRITDDELLRLGPVEMLKFVRKTESDIARVAAEQNRQIQSLVSFFFFFYI